MFHKKETEPQDDIVCVAVIQNMVTSAVYQDILRENGIPFICCQPGAGGYMKILTGGMFSADNIYVRESQAEQARGLYDAYLDSETGRLNGESDDSETDNTDYNDDYNED